MKQILAIAFITLLALGTACAWISPSSDATSEGINVHGHWTVTVTNPDGTVDAVHEFDNALFGDPLGGGGSALISLLLGENNVDEFYIGLQISANFGCKQQTTPNLGKASGAISLPADAHRTYSTKDGEYDTDVLSISSFCTVDMETGDYHNYPSSKIGEITEYTTNLADKDKCFPEFDSDEKSWKVENNFNKCNNGWPPFPLDGSDSFNAGYVMLTNTYGPVIYVENKQKVAITVKISFS